MIDQTSPSRATIKTIFGFSELSLLQELRIVKNNNKLIFLSI
jgi:hypothetical protein